MKPNEDGINGLTMHCEQVEEQRVIERYISEKLPAKEVEAFEQHYLGCRRCFAELQMRHAAAIELKHSPALAPSAARSRWKTVLRWSLVPAMTVVAIVTLIYVRPGMQALRPPSQTSEPAALNAALIEQLASLDQIPPYMPGVIRGAQSNQALEKFQAGMQEYTAGNYAKAVTILGDAVKLDAQLKPAVFYLGVSYLITNQPEAAIRQLSALTSDPNYAEDSHWYLAKAYLKQRNLSLATAELQAVSTLNGPHGSQARNDLETLKPLTGR